MPIRYSLVALGLMALTCGSAMAHNHGGDDKSKSDIVDTAVAAGQFSTLAAAL